MLTQPLLWYRRHSVLPQASAYHNQVYHTLYGAKGMGPSEENSGLRRRSTNGVLGAPWRQVPSLSTSSFEGIWNILGRGGQVCNMRLTRSENRIVMILTTIMKYILSRILSCPRVKSIHSKHVCFWAQHFDTHIVEEIGRPCRLSPWSVLAIDNPKTIKCRDLQILYMSTSIH